MINIGSFPISHPLEPLHCSGSFLCVYSEMQRADKKEKAVAFSQNDLSI